LEINITGRNLGITDRFRDYATEKAEKVEHLADKALALEVKLCRHHSATGSPGDDRVELTLIGPGPIVRAESAASDKYAAFDLALAKLMERVRRAKDRKKVHRGKHRPVSLRAVDAVKARVEEPEPSAYSEDDDYTEYTPVVIREKVFPAAPMTVDDALYYMELVGHDFYLFIDADSMRPSVVYRRKGWEYGVIGLDDSSTVTDGAVAQAGASAR
jgi:ribosomal subunit interface protein